MAKKTERPLPLKYFADPPDLRIDRCKGRELIEIIAIPTAICGKVLHFEHSASGEKGRPGSSWALDNREFIALDTECGLSR